MMPRLLGVLRQFPFSSPHPGIGQVAVHPISWNEPVVFQHAFDYGADPERVLAQAGEFLHSDYAYELEALWDLWAPSLPESQPQADREVLRSAQDFARGLRRPQTGSTSGAGTSPGDDLDESAAAGSQSWVLRPRVARFVAYGIEFEENAFRQMGHIQVDFGWDTPFLHEELELTPAIEQRVKANIQKLVNFTAQVEKNCGVSGRVLWSESEENLAQKLIARLQRAQ